MCLSCGLVWRFRILHVILLLLSRLCQFRFGVCLWGEFPSLLICVLVERPSSCCTFSTGFATSAGLLGAFFTGYATSAGLLGAFSTGFATSAGLLGAFSAFPSRGVAPTSGCVVFLVLPLARAPMEDNRRSADDIPTSLGVCCCFVGGGGVF